MSDSHKKSGRRKAPPPSQSNKLDAYFTVTGPSSAASGEGEIPKKALEGGPKRKHTGENISKSTFDEWTRLFPWLIISYPTEENDSTCIRLSCSICTKLRGKLNLRGVWAWDGSSTIQRNSITRHGTSSDHKSAYELFEKSSAIVEGASVEDSESDVEAEYTVSQEDKVLFGTVYFAAKTELPSTSINDLLKLQSIHGVQTKYQNLSPDTVTTIQKSISATIKLNIVKEIKESEYFGLILDESTDITNVKMLCICIRYVKAGKPVTKFLCNVPIDDGCAHTIVSTVAKEISCLGLDMSKCVSLGTDGASVMMGKHMGVGKQIEAKYSPFCLQTHCVAHRLNLACNDTIKKNEFMVKFREKFNQLYYFMSGSSVRTLSLRKIQSVLEEPELSIKEPHSIRWLGLKNAVEAVFESYASVVTTLSKFAAEKNPVAKGLFKYFNNYKVALVTAFMYDVHSAVAILSCKFQKENLLFSEISPLRDSTIGALEKLKTTDGSALKTMKQNIIVTDTGDGKEAVLKCEKMSYRVAMDSEFETLREEYCLKMGRNINNRLKNSTSVFDDLSKVFEPDVVNETSVEDKLIHGSLTEGTEIEETEIPALLDPEKLEDEWFTLRAMLIGSYKNLTSRILLRRIRTLHKQTMPSFYILAGIALCIQLTSVDCERSFSFQNRVKNKFRASLKSEKVDLLMNIAMLGEDFTVYNPAKAVQHWLRQKKRRKGRLFAGYQPRLGSKKQKTCQRCNKVSTEFMYLFLF